MWDSAVVKSDLIMSINAGFKINGISIPFPQQDLHFPNAKHKDFLNK